MGLVFLNVNAWLRDGDEKRKSHEGEGGTRGR